MARGVTDRVLENSEGLQELAEQIFTNVGCTEKCRTILQGNYGIFFSPLHFLHVHNYHSEILNTFQYNEISL
jgi:hypothetical protein